MSTTTRFSSRVATAFITERRAFATPPPRPITRPRSSSATSSSRTTSPSISSASLTWTESGSSTSERARNSSRSRTGPSTQPLAAGRLDALGAEERGDRLGRARALLQPVLRPVLVDHDQRGVGLRVVLADRLDRATVARRALVGDDHPPDRVLLAPDPPKSNSHGHAAAE